MALKGPFKFKRFYDSVISFFFSNIFSPLLSSMWASELVFRVQQRGTNGYKIIAKVVVSVPQN